MAFWHLFATSFLAVSNVLLLSFIGAFLARKGILDARGRHTLSQVVFWVFTPCLVFSKLAASFTLSNLKLWWFLPFNTLASICIGLLVGHLGGKIVQPAPWFRRHIMCSVALGNVGMLPLVLIDGICSGNTIYQRALPGLLCQGNGTAYVAVSLWLVNISNLTVAYNLLKLPKALPSKIDQTPTETSVGPTLQNQPEAATLQNEGGCSSEISAAIPATAPMTQPTASMPAKGILAFGAGGEPARGILASGAGGEPGRTGSAAAAVIYLTANATGASQRETTIPAGEPARGVHWHDNLAGDAPKVVEIAADDIADAKHQEAPRSDWGSADSSPLTSRATSVMSLASMVTERDNVDVPLVHGSASHSNEAGSYWDMSAADMRATLPTQKPRWLGRGSQSAVRRRKKRHEIRRLMVAIPWGSWLNLATVSALAGILVGCIAPLRGLLYGTYPAFGFLATALQVMGAGMVPSMLLVLGASLHKGPGSAILPNRVIMGVVAMRLIIMPCIGTLFVMGLKAARAFTSPDPVFLFVLLITHAVPTSLNLQTVATLNQNGEEEISCLLFWQYICALITLPLWMSVFAAV